MIIPGILLAGTGPLGVAAGVGTASLAKTFLAKRSHFNKEHRLYQRQQAVNLFNNRSERDRLERLVGGMSPMRRFFR